ncbi:thiamine biosynthesis lipoprotein [Kutzneria buriramensis]|uniref:FAD:protein FMN transferase n=2 Tax=Kutzneria buriramensis TaxID=1045776 RepID=A0A3E0HV76_9PSEU|nr:thiamine biosynthesis lipoprotein [Kutzneria buriramensis]
MRQVIDRWRADAPVDSSPTEVPQVGHSKTTHSGDMRHVEQVMGMPVSVDVRDPVDVAPLYEDLRRVDARFSPFKPDSEVSRYGRGEVAEVSDELAEVLGICSHYERISSGAFTATLPGRPFDPCGVVKGWAVQRAADLLRKQGATRFCVNAGGDVVAAGEPEPGRPWLVGIRHPELADRMCAVLGVSDLAVATSATYERGEHILDGRTGLQARGLLSVTVVAADLTTADCVATAAFAMGRHGVAWADAQPGCLIFAVDADHVVHRSAGLDRHLIADVT